MKLKHFAVSLLLTTSPLLFAQDQAPENWFNLDLNDNKVQGVSTEKSYKELLKDKKSSTIVVAILDTGIDEEHEDLKDVMWRNEDEIPGNGIDDDKNGYIDDIFGWNFLGGKDGKNVKEDTYEVTRLYGYLKDKKRNSKEEKVFRSVKKQFEAIYNEYKTGYETSEAFIICLSTITEALDGAPCTSKNIEALSDDSELIKLGKQVVLELLAGREPTDTLEVQPIIESFQEELESYVQGLKYSYNPEFNSRTVIGDDYFNSSEKFYGNNDVTGPDAEHGTHVAGIVGAVRGNNIGMEGVANNVRLMSVRIVPDGDERDKDVANGIIYAVDNGAKIINMSFGKSYVFDKKIVDAAIKYAEQKGVLLVHAAGNSSENIDVENNYPNQFPEDKRSNKTYSNWIEVGAFSWQEGVNAVADFSNYGKKSVDVFAPGVDIYAPIPGSKYDSFSGTSMASPVTAGVAALVWSYYPELTVQELRTCIVNSTSKFFDYVYLPGTSKEVEFKQLCNTSGIVNAYNALKMAEQIIAAKKK